MSATEVKVPALGESVTEATVAQWLKKKGEAVATDEPLVELETDKITLEVNAPADGVLGDIMVNEGDSVEVGALLASIVTDGSVAATVKNDNDKKAAPAAAVASKEESKPAPQKAEADMPLSPAVRKLVDENDVSPADISGTGKDGRITKGDVLAHLEEGPAPKPAAASPSAAASTEGQEERVRMSKLRQTIAKRLKSAQDTAAILTTFNEVDMSRIMQLRKTHQDAFVKKHGHKLGFMSFFVKAAVEALKDIPAVNAQIDGADIIYKNYYNVGVAVGTDQGLVVPVLRNADRLGFAEIEQEIIDLSVKARDGRLSMADMSGGTFTITNGGIYGSMLSTPILNPPQSAILGMHNIVQRPVVLPNGSIEARPVMYLALSYDHRIIDGKEAVTFLVKIKQALEDPERMLLGV